MLGTTYQLILGWQGGIPLPLDTKRPLYKMPKVLMLR